MRRILLLLAVAVAGCNARSNARLEQRQREQEQEILELRARVSQLQDDVRGLEGKSNGATDRPAFPDASTAVPSGPITSRCKPGTGGHDFEITRSPIDFGGLAREARIVPNFQDGKGHGMKVFSIRPGSFLASCGFLNGDVVLSVNDLTLDDPDHALQAYSLGRTAPELDFAILREGKPATVTVHLLEH